MFISHQPSLPSHYTEPPFSQELGLNSLLNIHSKVVNKTATTNLPSYDLDSPKFLQAEESDQQFQERKIREKLQALKEYKRKMDIRFKGCIKKLEGNLCTKKQLNRKLREEVHILGEECKETMKDLEMIRRMMNIEQHKNQFKEGKTSGRPTLSRHIFTQTTIRRKASNITKISRK